MPLTSPPATNSVADGPATHVRVRYCECDPMGVAHHASFVPWLEIARTESLRATGHTYAQMEADGVFLVVTGLDIRFRRPARYDDVLRVSCEASIVGKARLRHAYTITLAEPGDGEMARLGDQPLATASTELACVDTRGRPQPMPAWLTDAVEART